MSDLSPLSFDPSVFSPLTKEIKTQEDLINSITEYFDALSQLKRSPTFTGLAMVLSISRSQLRNFPKDNPFYPIIEKAKQFIVSHVEEQLFEPKSSAGVAFWLKNNDDWEDKSSVQLSHHKSMKEILEEINDKNQSPIDYIEGETVPPISPSTNDSLS